MPEDRDVGEVSQFSRRAPGYEGRWNQWLFFDRLHFAVLGLLAGGEPPFAPGVILDVGCGTGRLLRQAAARWPRARLVGVDPAEGMVAMARRRTPAATLCVGMAESLPLPDASVDAVLSTASFHHWRDQAAGVREIARVLRPGGRFALADVFLPRPLYGLVGHFHPNDSAALPEVFARAGLTLAGQRRLSGGVALATLGVKQP